MLESSLLMPHRRRRLAAVAFGLLLIPSLGSTALSLALFTDQESVDGVFSTGSVALDAAKIDALTLSASGLVPGASLTDDVVVENDGTIELRYALTTSSTNADSKALRDVLQLTVKTVDVTTPGTPCDDFDGASTLYSGALGASTAGFGDATAGAQAGDRTLAAAASETLCVRVALPASAGDPYQGASTTTTFSFVAEQTASNP